MRWIWFLLLGLTLLPSCADPTGSEDIFVPDGQLTFVRFSTETEIADSSGSFWAVRGDHTRIRLRYAPEPGEQEGDTFLEFDVPGDGLFRSPEGVLYEDGDSVLITVEVDDAGRFLFTFSPSGLQFHPDHPAELRVRYAKADHDLDGDGDEDEDDLAIERSLALWRQELPGAPWMRVGTAEIDEDLDDVRADIAGFTSFSLASN